MTLVLLKLLLAPGLVVASTLAGRRWGPRVAGVLVALPIVAGPILLFTYLDHGARFAAAAASSSLLGLATLALFAATFARLSLRLGWAASLGASWIVCIAADLAFSMVRVPPLVGLCVAVAVTYAAALTLPATSQAPAPDRPGWPWWDLPGRAVATAVLVLGVTGASAALGPELTGVFAPFPIATSVVVGFVLAQSGSDAAIATLRGVLLGLTGFALFCFLLAVLIEPAGGPAAFCIATTTALVTPVLQRRLVSDTGGYLAGRLR
ncbi:hypothetical protein [Pseudonocardia sp. TRM90224]|uniref:hypothetical protein n=1 Tax=Pseudonocardia sp. TRM90224 TaxID=2812678 RepID=UPI001E3EEAAA|nr:hypothetical protein [Pseudonocardia sp. TRM90224]